MEAPQMLYPAVVRTLEQYEPRVQALIATTDQIAGELRHLLGNRLRGTPPTVQITAGDLLKLAMKRGGLQRAPMVPYEASAALSMLLLRDYGMLMVHFVGVPPGTGGLLIKFVPPETLERFGGAGKYAEAVNDSLTRLGELLGYMDGEHPRTAARQTLPAASSCAGDEPAQCGVGPRRRGGGG
jgi:L-seryl-tRNA(Ser) seleniumtransferase